MEKIYLDYAATTPVREEVLAEMLPYFTEKFGNPSSIHSFGREARIAVEESRKRVAKVLNCLPEEVIFTGTTTTSDNLAILGLTGRWSEGLIATSQIEHHAILDIFKVLEKQGFTVDWVPVNEYGEVIIEKVEETIRAGAKLISIMYANNEIGTIQPVAAIGKMVADARKSGQEIYLHTDAAAAGEYLELDVQKLGVDLLTLGAHKFGGPKGIGILFVRKGVKINPVTFGGHHEMGFWPGTEATPLIVGAAKALELAEEERDSLPKQVTLLRDRLIKGVLESVPEALLTGHPTNRLPDIASFCFDGAEGEAVLLRMDALGVAASSGSACTSGELKPSHVLLAAGIPQEVAHGSIRFSLGRETTTEQIDYVLEKLPGVVAQLREMNPVYEPKCASGIAAP